ncbi:MAG: hypothetical protein R3C19_16565 [Planctomycetaceae bacterium]
MTESQVEKQLRQIALTEPSGTLDERVKACFAAPVAVVVSSGGGVVPWRLLTTVAVVCLLIGGALGRVASVAFVENGASSDPRSTPDSGSDPDSLPANPGDSEIVIVSDASVDAASGAFEFPVAVQGPSLSILCTMVQQHSVPGSAEERCLQCHHGIRTVTPQFRSEHVRDPRFEVCMWCHDTNDGIDSLLRSGPADLSTDGRLR